MDTIGYVVHVDDENISISTSRAKVLGHYYGPLTIPLQAVVELKELPPSALTTHS